MKKRILGTLGAAMAAMAVFVTPLHRAGAVEQNAAAGEDPAVLAEEIALGNIFLFPDEPAAASDAVSYTHLDVYKRQRMGCSTRRSSASSTST